MKMLQTFSTRLLSVGVAAAAIVGLSMNAQAQITSSNDCIVGNWNVQEGLTNDDAGIQPDGFKRYGGPCGLRVPVDETPRFLTDESPLAEGAYIARFYAFLDQAPGEKITIFSTTDGSDEPVFSVIYDGAENELILEAFPGPQDLVFTDVGTGWQSIEVVWEASSAADNIRFALNTEEDGQDITSGTSVDTSGLQIAKAHLGNVSGTGASGTLYFDDFDSRRLSRPGRLMRGDANNDGVVDGDDQAAIVNEFLFGEPAQGNPDCNEDGSVDGDDQACIINIFLFGE